MKQILTYVIIFIGLVLICMGGFWVDAKWIRYVSSASEQRYSVALANLDAGDDPNVVKALMILDDMEANLAEMKQIAASTATVGIDTWKGPVMKDGASFIISTKSCESILCYDKDLNTLTLTGDTTANMLRRMFYYLYDIYAPNEYLMSAQIVVDDPNEPAKVLVEPFDCEHNRLESVDGYWAVSVHQLEEQRGVFIGRRYKCLDCGSDIQITNATSDHELNEHRNILADVDLPRILEEFCTCDEKVRVVTTCLVFGCDGKDCTTCFECGLKVRWK